METLIPRAADLADGAAPSNGRADRAMSPLRWTATSTRTMNEALWCWQRTASPTGRVSQDAGE